MCNVNQRKRILERDGHRCVWCGVGTEYNGKPLTHQIDHIDGNRKNNSDENLRTMCPNCHSQTDTYTFNKTKSDFDNRLKKHLEKMTKEQIEKFFLDHTYEQIVDITGTSHSSLRKYVKENGIIPRHKAIKQECRLSVSKEELKTLVKTHTLIDIGKMYDVSPTAVSKKMKRWGIKLDHSVWIEKMRRVMKKKHEEGHYRNNKYHVNKDCKKVSLWDETNKRELWFPSIKDAARHLPLCKNSIKKILNKKVVSIKGFSLIEE